MSMKDKTLKKLEDKKSEILNKLRGCLLDIFANVPVSVLNIPVLSIIDALDIEYEGREVKIEKVIPKQKRESTVILDYKDQYRYNGKIFIDKNGRVKDDIEDVHIKKLLKKVKKTAKKLGRNMSIFIE